MSRPSGFVDCHTHVFCRGLRTVAGARYRPDYDATVERLNSVMRENGVAGAVLVQPSFLGNDNSYLLECLGAYPDRFRGVVVFEAAELSKLTNIRLGGLHDRGVRGVRLNLVGRRLPSLGDTAWRKFGSLLSRMGWHLEVQCEGMRWLLLEEAIGLWPSRVVVDHVGLPDGSPRVAGCLMRLAAMGHVWIKVSAPYRSDGGRDLAKRIVRDVGPGRLVWGSDWPWTRHEADQTYDLQLEWLSHLSDDAAELQEAFSFNAGELFWRE